MNLQISGESAAARALSTYLQSLGYSLDGPPRFTLRIEESTERNIALIGVRGAFADEALHAIAELSRTPIEWRRSSNGGENELLVQANSVDHDAVERGLLRALLKITGHGSIERSQSGWRRFLRFR
jgi:hypothetical protein